MKEETGVKIDSEELLTILECTICYTAYNEPATTKCGHTYCKSCIEACIDRHHECPDCKTKLTRSDITRNIQIERMQRQIVDLQEKAKKDPLAGLGQAPMGYVMSPVVDLFQGNIRECMNKFETFCQNIKNDLERAKGKIKEKMLHGVKVDEEKEIVEIEKKYKNVIDMIIKQYDLHMKDGVQEPKISPIKVIVQIPSKGLRIENVNLRPYDTLRDIKPLIEKQFEIQKNQILKWGSNIRYVILKPLLVPQQPALEENKEEGVEIFDEMKPIYELNLLPQSRIIVEGKIICVNDVGKPCITLNFKPEDKKAFDYYSCDTCKINWICEPCAQQCHKGHDIKTYLKGHIPPWACCYFFKA